MHGLGERSPFRHKKSHFGTLAHAPSLNLQNSCTMTTTISYCGGVSLFCFHIVLRWQDSLLNDGTKTKHARTAECSMETYNGFLATASLVCRLLYATQYPIHCLGWSHVRISCVQVCVCVCVCVCVQCNIDYLDFDYLTLWLSNHLALLHA